MTWIILRCKSTKEPYVTDAINRMMDYKAWHPVQIIVCRPSMDRRITSKAQLRLTKDISILPRRVFVSGPDLHDGEVQAELRTLQHVEALETDSEQRLVMIPDAQIAAFRAEINRENTASLMLAQKASRKQKAKWRSLHDALLDMIDGAKQQMEAAA